VKLRTIIIALVLAAIIGAAVGTIMGRREAHRRQLLQETWRKTK